MSAPGYCVFCEIVAGRSPARVRYLDNEIIVIVNKLTWVPLMLLVMPKQHMEQSEMWSSGLMGKLGEVAVDMGWSAACTWGSTPSNGLVWSTNKRTGSLKLQQRHRDRK